MYYFPSFPPNLGSISAFHLVLFHKNNCSRTQHYNSLKKQRLKNEYKTNSHSHREASSFYPLISYKNAPPIQAGHSQISSKTNRN